MGTPKRKRSHARTRGRKRPDGTDALLPHGCALTSERRAAVLGCLIGGGTRSMAAAAAGVSERTLQRWVRKGKDNLDAFDRSEDDDTAEPVDLDVYGALVLDVVKSESEVRSELLTKIRTADDWRAWSWYLERVARREFGKVVKTEEVGTDEYGEERSAGDILLEKLQGIRDREDAFEKGVSGGVGDG